MSLRMMMRFLVVLALSSMMIPTGGNDVTASTLGQLDTSFGNGDGTTKASLGTDFSIMNMAIQNDGKIIVVGRTNNGQGLEHVFVTRLLANGTIDSSWGQGGILRLFPEPVSTGDHSEARAVVVQPDGKIVIAGIAGPNPGVSHIFVSRLTSTGQLDTNFDGDGHAFLAIPNFNAVFDLLLQPDGHLVVVAANFDGNATPTTYSWVLVRFRPNGTLDSGFNTGGNPPGLFRQSTTSSFNGAFRGTLLADGSIIAVGMYDNKATIMKITPDGRLDTNFGVQGIVSTDHVGISDSIFDVAVLPDGKILTAGSTEITSATYRPTLARYSADGVLDSSFGTNGIVLPTNINGADNVNTYRMARLRDGRIVMTGRLSYRNTNPTREDFGMWLFQENGQVDTSVYPNGLYVLSGGGTSSNGDYRMFAMAIQSDDKVVVAGEAETANNDQFLLRFNSMIPASVPTTTTAPPAALTPAPTPLAYRAANKQVTLRWRAVEGAASYVVTTTRGSQRCDTTATSCVISRLRNGKAYTYLVYSVNADGVRSETAARISARPGFVVKRTSLKAKRTLKLSSIVSTKSKGAKTWRVTSGGCRIQGNRLVAPTKRGTCRLRLATTKRGSYPAMSTTIKLAITR